MVTISNTLLEERDTAIITDDNFSLEIADKGLVHQEIETIGLSHTVLETPNGMIGFETIKQYAIEVLEGNIVYRLEGMPDNHPVFYLMNPYLMLPHYTLSLRDEEYALLGSPIFDDIIVFSILTLQEKMSDTTCNLLGPLVINNKIGVMLQIINDSDDWGTKHILSTGEKVVELTITSGEKE